MINAFCLEYFRLVCALIHLNPQKSYSCEDLRICLTLPSISVIDFSVFNVAKLCRVYALKCYKENIGP